METTKRRMTATFTPRPVHYQAPDDGIMTIGERVNQVNRYLLKTGKHWAGTQAEYDAWAVRSMQRFLETIAYNLCMAEPEGGAA